MDEQACRKGLGRAIGALLRAFACVAACLVLSALIAAQEPENEPQDGDSATEQGLALVNLDLLDSQDGYAIPADSRFLPGETVHVYFQIAGYHVGEEDRVSLRYEVRALDPDGRRFYSAEGGEIDVEIAPQDENWMPVVRYSPWLPQHAGGGTYSIEVEVRDELGQTSVSASVPVEVDGTRVQRADELLVRNFKFVEAESGSPMEQAVFGPGDEIRAEFFITGYEIRQDNTFQVESDAWVLDPEGERVFEFESSGERGNPYYPRLWLPAQFRLDLDADIPAGLYTVVVRLRDLVGGSDAAERYAFRIR